MKKIRAGVVGALYLLVFSVIVGCNSNTEPEDGPTICPTEDVLLKSMEDNKLYIVRSADELSNYVVDVSQIADIDYTKHSLLLVKGGANYGIQQMSSKFKTEGSNYIFVIDIELNDTTEAPKWQVIAVVHALADDVNVELSINVD